MRYRLIEADNANKLTEKVNGYLADGWKLHGSPIHDTTRHMFLQAVVTEN